jgi:hypothetical protein
MALRCGRHRLGCRPHRLSSLKDALAQLVQALLTQVAPAQQSVSLPQVTGTPAGMQQTLLVQKPS